MAAKCPTNCFFLYCQLTREKVKADNPHFNSSEVTSALGKNWQNLNDKQKEALAKVKKFLEKNQSTGVQDVLNKVVFDLLEYIAIHPGGVSKLEDSKGNVLPDCFLMPKDSTALDFAYRLHTDFGEKFIRAIDVRTKKTVGKEHKLKHLDILEIVADK